VLFVIIVGFSFSWWGNYTDVHCPVKRPMIAVSGNHDEKDTDSGKDVNGRKKDFSIP
jgi:hypothetical protein